MPARKQTKKEKPQGKAWFEGADPPECRIEARPDSLMPVLAQLHKAFSALCRPVAWVPTMKCEFGTGNKALDHRTPGIYLTRAASRLGPSVTYRKVLTSLTFDTSSDTG